MSPTPTRPSSRTPSLLLPPLTALGEVPSPAPESDGEVEADELAFTIESPSRVKIIAEDEWDSSEVINNTAVTPLVPGDRE
ncbi:hypothetical protein C8J55DRAFT_566560 [Lentinula edodes]|uniref:Uncharacterized protein n=1 Tax=Lentinula lateritia TaxID=40482 RepID=A0A9W8ZRR4_9AGAR|nr:hypothetical protein C8J55DRAFT_566560 [Lentinula edodes]